MLVVKQFGGGGVEEPRLNSVSIRFCKRFAVDLDDPEGSDFHAHATGDGRIDELGVRVKEQGKKELMCGGVGCS
jgi:hypothetical protein